MSSNQPGPYGGGQGGQPQAPYGQPPQTPHGQVPPPPPASGGGGAHHRVVVVAEESAQEGGRAAPGWGHRKAERLPYIGVYGKVEDPAPHARIHWQGCQGS